MVIAVICSASGIVVRCGTYSLLVICLEYRERVIFFGFVCSQYIATKEVEEKWGEDEERKDSNEKVAMITLRNIMVMVIKMTIIKNKIAIMIELYHKNNTEDKENASRNNATNDNSCVDLEIR